MKYSLIFWATVYIAATILCRYIIFRRVPKMWRLGEDQTAIVTGSGSGIGCQIAQQLSERGGKVVWAARDIVKAKRIFDDTIWTRGHGPQGYLLHMDLASKASIEKFVEGFKSRDKKLNLLVLNAAYHGSYRLTNDGFEQTIGVNHLGHMYLCYLLIDMLKNCGPSRIVVVASDIHRLTKAVRMDDLMYKNRKDYSPWSAYNHSKVLNILFARELSKRLLGTNVKVHAANPGTPVLTELLRESKLMTQMVNQCILRPLSFLFCRSTKEAAQTILHCALSPECGVISGEYFENCRQVVPSKIACDEEAAGRLWDVSCDLLNIKRDWL